MSVSKMRPVDIEPEIEQLRRVVSERTVAILREWLARAESGEISDVIVVGFESPSGDTRWEATPTESHTRQIGALEIVKHDLVADLISRDFEP